MSLKPDLLRQSYSFNLPPELIAERPTSKRSACRLLVYEQKRDLVTHSTFDRIADFLPAQTLLVMNQSRVFPARVWGQKSTGAKAELFLLSLQASEQGLWSLFIRSNHRKKLGDEWIPFTKNGEPASRYRLRIEQQCADGAFYCSVANNENLALFFKQEGSVPIPQYIRGGKSDEQDVLDYQTVFASEGTKDQGSIAAPTAGLHFDEELLQQLAAQGIEQAKVTLHVGLGTFSPVKTEDIREHQMHEEIFYVDADHLQKINQHYQRALPVVAVGTTSLRTLESCYSFQKRKILLSAGEIQKTSIFLNPQVIRERGYPVNSIQGLITNFHLPESTLLMLVSALIGREKVLSLYAEAIRERYRFFSYGDAMLILP